MSTAAVVPFKKKDDLRAEFVMRIQAAIGKSIECFVEVGTTLNEAKEKLEHGSFEAMVRDDLHLSPRTARKFMAIAQSSVFRNRRRGADLPPVCDTLAELAQMTESALEKAIADGKVHADMTRADARALLGKKKKTKKPKPSAPKAIPASTRDSAPARDWEAQPEENRVLTKEEVELEVNGLGLYLSALMEPWSMETRRWFMGKALTLVIQVHREYNPKPRGQS